MKKNISINIFGTIYPIDEDAYELLKKYNENMRRYYSRREGGDEIADDVEHRVAELLSELRSQGVMAITIDHIKEIINRIGDPQEMDDADTTEGTYESADNGSNENSGMNTSTGGSDRQHAADFIDGNQTRKLFRDPEDKLLGGVLSGLSHYFGIKETPALGSQTELEKGLFLYRLPSSSRAYPLAFEKKVAAYQAVFREIW